MDGEACGALQNFEVHQILKCTTLKAVAALTKLTSVNLQVWQACECHKYHVPLSVFSAAPSLQALTYIVDKDRDSNHGEYCSKLKGAVQGFLSCDAHDPVQDKPCCHTEMTGLRNLDLGTSESTILPSH